MDVNALTTGQHEEMMRKGLCFGCGKPGHISKNCPDKKKLANTPIATTSWKMNGKELFAHVRSITMEMDEDEKEKFYEEAKKEGF
jgi:zinc knuckle protein